MALTDDATTSSTNTGGIASTLTALNNASSNMYVICAGDLHRFPILRSMWGHCCCCTAGLVGASLLATLGRHFGASSFLHFLLLLLTILFMFPRDTAEKVYGIKVVVAKHSAVFNPVSPREPKIILLRRKTKSLTARISDRLQYSLALAKKSHFIWNACLPSSRKESNTIWVSFISIMLF